MISKKKLVYNIPSPKEREHLKPQGSPILTVFIFRIRGKVNSRSLNHW